MENVIVMADFPLMNLLMGVRNGGSMGKNIVMADFLPLKVVMLSNGMSMDNFIVKADFPLLFVLMGIKNGL